MLGGRKNLIDSVFEKVFYAIHKKYNFGFILLDVLALFRRDYILEKRRRGRKFIYIPLAIDYVQRELFALKYLRNKILLSKGNSLFEKIFSEIINLFYFRKMRSKDFEDMQKLLKENARFAHFRWKKKKVKVKKFFSVKNNY